MPVNIFLTLSLKFFTFSFVSDSHFFLERAEKGPIPHGRCFGCIKTCKPADTPYCITEALIRAVEGDVENGLLFCGSNACRSDKIEKVEDILGEVADALK